MRKNKQKHVSPKPKTTSKLLKDEEVTNVSGGANVIVPPLLAVQTIADTQKELYDRAMRVINNLK